MTYERSESRGQRLVRGRSRERTVDEGQRRKRQAGLYAGTTENSMKKGSIVTNAVDRFEKDGKRFHMIYQLIS